MTPPTELPVLMTPREAAALLSISVSTLNRARRNSGLPCVRIGTGVIRYRRESILAWIEDQEAAEGPRAETPAPRSRPCARPAVSLLD